MTKILSELLNAKEPMFSIAVKQLEQASAHQGMDVRLTAEIIGKMHMKMRELGLDPRDTTGAEFEAALENLIRKHDDHLAKEIGASGSKENVDKLIGLIRDKAATVETPKSCWVLKKSVAREFLRSMPPPNIMKTLGYTSVDSMLKSENLYEIYGALRFAEGPEWLNDFDEKYLSLKPSDFETRQIEIVIMPHDRWADICDAFVHKKRHNITHLKELGVILMLPIKAETMPGITLWAFSLIFHYINEIRLYSAFFKLKSTQPHFGKTIVETLIADPGNAAIMAGQNVHWRVIQRYFGKLEKEFHPEIFQPHVQPEDLHWRRAEDVLYMIDPELAFWKDMDYVGLIFDGRPVTLNMMDVAASATNNNPYGEQAVYHFRESLWNELFVRYMGQKTLEQQVLKQLDNDMIAPERVHPDFS
jgi:hypothetical protein